MNQQKQSIVCKDCAATGKLKWLPCGTHHVIIPSEMCAHEFTSQIIIENGEGLTCHDCGTQISLVTEKVGA